MIMEGRNQKLPNDEKKKTPGVQSQLAALHANNLEQEKEWACLLAS